MKKIIMNVASRLTLLMNLPERGSVTDMISKRNIRNKIDFSSEEVEKDKIKNDEGKIMWSSDSPDIEVEFNESEVTFLKTIIDKMDKEGLINDGILDFAQKILNN